MTDLENEMIQRLAELYALKNEEAPDECYFEFGQELMASLETILSKEQVAVAAFLADEKAE